MAKLYKLTNENGQSYNNTQWGPGVSHSGTGKGELCGEGWIHAYTHPLLAVLFNPIHANFQNPKLWEAKGVIEKKDHELKVGCKTLTTIREISLPQITHVQKVAFGILAAQKVCNDQEWNLWAQNWLSGKNRSTEAAAAAAEEAVWTAAAARAAAAAAEEAAEEAEWAARWAVWTAEKAAAWAAEEAAKETRQSFSLISIAQQAVKNF